jgi:hypothetical protein
MRPRTGKSGSPVSRRTSPQFVKEVLEQDDGVVWSWRFRCRDGERDGESLAVRGDVEASQPCQAGRPRARLVGDERLSLDCVADGAFGPQAPASSLRRYLIASSVISPSASIARQWT